MLLFIYGKDSYRSQQHLNRVILQFQEKYNVAGSQIERFDMREANADEVIDLIGASSLFVTKRLVVLSHFLNSKQEKLNTYLTNTLTTYNDREDIVLVIYEHDEHIKLPLYKLLIKLRYVYLFSEMSPGEASAWIKEWCENRGIACESEVISFLSRTYCADTWSLHSLLTQLQNFIVSEQRAIMTLTDIRVFVSVSLDENIFHCIDALNTSDCGKAFLHLDELFETGHEPVEIIGLFLWQYRTMIKVRSLLDANPKFRGRDVASALNLKPFVADKTTKLVSNTNLEKLQEQYSDLVQLTQHSKSGPLAQAELISCVGRLIM